MSRRVAAELELKDKEKALSETIREAEFDAIKKNLHIGNPVMRAAIARDKEAARLERGEDFQAFKKQNRAFEFESMCRHDFDIDESSRPGVLIITMGPMNRDRLNRAAAKAALSECSAALSARYQARGR